MEKLGFAANTILFGVGAFSFSAMVTEEDGMVVLTRDTFGFAMKATHCIINGKEYTIQKDPKTDKGSLKKSHRGCVLVYWNGKEYVCRDGYTREQLEGDYYDMSHKAMSPLKEIQSLTTVFKDGQLYNEETFEQIRDRLHNGMF